MNRIGWIQPSSLSSEDQQSTVWGPPTLVVVRSPLWYNSSGTDVCIIYKFKRDENMSMKLMVTIYAAFQGWGIPFTGVFNNGSGN